ncbi:hypothetical protein UFOVP1290_572 [uncultured Caudovirales phage]|uniref:Uncharacterized protein n=1 Tax=uncultured Caudovirales phage TaxID=2100421 RepID=A0A6J5RLW2_9CAUD|nr:hypothetical protein UFOVP1290_572 [uncultured Caudovirales phage]
MGDDVLKTEFILKYKHDGEHAFYRFLLTYALNKLILIENETYRGISPNLEFLEYSERLIFLYRKEGDDICLQVSRLFRKAAHKIYRVMLKKNMTDINSKFLNLV